MGETTFSCRHCGALLKAWAFRCYSCGSAAKSSATPANTPVAGTTAPNSGDAALSKKLRPLKVRRRSFWLLGSALSFLAALAASLFVYFHGLTIHRAVAFSVILGGSCIGMILNTAFTRKSKEYGKEEKALVGAQVVESLLAGNFELIEYAPQKSFSMEQLLASQLRGWSSFEGNDFFRGTYKGVSFAFSDVQLAPLFFKGQWLILDLHREMPAPLMISELEDRGSFGKKARVQIEEPPKAHIAQAQFSNTFTILTDTSDLVSQVLTPDFMEFLLGIGPPPASSASHTGKHLLFEGKQVHIFIYSDHDLFELAGSEVQNIPAFLERVQREIDFIKRVIDGFLLIEGLFEGRESK